MALWLVRAGSKGQQEQKFLDESRVYLCWGGLNQDLGQIEDRKQLRELLEQTYQDSKPGKITQNSGQIWAFAKKISKGDWVALPSKSSPSIHIGEVVGDYTYHAEGPNPYFHSIPVKWLELDIPRTHFDQDILYSLGAFLTICEIKRNNAETRVRAMQGNQWRATRVSLGSADMNAGTQDSEDDIADSDEVLAHIDLERQARDQLSRHIYAKFKGHPMAGLVGEILRAQGYTVHQPPEGPDRGIDLLAAPGPLGFGEPRICVQVKSQDSPLDRPTLDQLLGTMSNVQADRGLLVCWGGFKSTVKREEAQQFFRVRLWDSDDLIDQVLQHYNKLGEETKAEIPLKQLWSLSFADDD